MSLASKKRKAGFPLRKEPGNLVISLLLLVHFIKKFVVCIKTRILREVSIFSSLIIWQDSLKGKKKYPRQDLVTGQPVGKKATELKRKQ